MLAQAHREGSFNLMFMLKWVSAAAASLWGSIPITIQSLFMLMMIDYIAGVLRAKKQGRCCWDQARNGLIDKTMVMLMLAACYWVCKAANLPINVGSGMAVPFCFTEFQSIVRNCKDMGMKLPAMALDLWERTKDRKSPKKRTR